MIARLCSALGRLLIAVSVVALVAGVALAPEAKAYGLVPKTSGTAWTLGPLCSGTNPETVFACYVNNYAPAYKGPCGFRVDGSSIVGATATVRSSKCVDASSEWVGNAPYSWAGVTAQVCPADSTEGAGSCICNSGFEKVGTACAPTNCTAKAGGLGGVTLSWTGNTSTTCYGGCVMSCGVRGYMSATNTSSCSGSFVIPTGESCMGAASGNNADGNNAGTGTGPGVCPSGQCPGTVGGVAVCVPCTGSAPGPSVTASAPGGAASAPPIPGAPPGTTSSDSGTTCSGDSCTTTTTYRDASGGVTGTTEKKEDKGSFCAENPGSPLCVKSSFSGSCLSGFVGEGDAVQVAMAKEVHRRNCELLDKTSDLSNIGNSGASGEARPTGHPGGAADTVSMSFGTVIDQTDRLSSGCPADVVIPFRASSLTIPFSQICPQLQMLGSLAVGVSMLAAAFIVFRG